MDFQEPREGRVICTEPHDLGFCYMLHLLPSGLLMSKSLNGPCSHLPAQVSSWERQCLLCPGNRLVRKEVPLAPREALLSDLFALTESLLFCISIPLHAAQFLGNPRC